MLIELTSQFPSGADGGVGSLSASSPGSGALSFRCCNCLTDWPEPFCDGCGASLKATGPHGSPSLGAPHGPEGDQYDTR